MWRFQPVKFSLKRSKSNNKILFSGWIPVDWHVDGKKSSRLFWSKWTLINGNNQKLYIIFAIFSLTSFQCRDRNATDFYRKFSTSWKLSIYNLVDKSQLVVLKEVCINSEKSQCCLHILVIFIYQKFNAKNSIDKIFMEWSSKRRKLSIDTSGRIPAGSLEERPVSISRKIIRVCLFRQFGPTGFSVQRIHDFFWLVDNYLEVEVSQL